jgi:hypothetical protein
MIPDAGDPPMPRPTLSVDFNEMLDADLVLLSATDTRRDARGDTVELREGMEVRVYDDDPDADGRPGKLVATGVVERNSSGEDWCAHVKWCCRIDAHGIQHQPTL